MKFHTPISLDALCHMFDLEYTGSPELIVAGINEIHRVQQGDIAFVDNEKYYSRALASHASVILIDKVVPCPEDKALIVHDNPFVLFNTILNHFSENNLTYSEESKVHPSSSIANNVFIGKNVQIGMNCVIHPGVYIGNNVEIGNNVLIGPNSVLGYHAFYYKSNNGEHRRMLTGGNIHIMDNVEIGALCSIDAGVTDTTRIGLGTKIDNQVQIGHDTIIGNHCLFAAGVGIAGCVIIEDHVTLWGQVGVASGITIEKNTTVLAQSGVSKNLSGGKTYFGSPCQEAKQSFKEMATLRALTSRGI